MKPTPPIGAALTAIVTLLASWVDDASATSVARGFVNETARSFEFNSGLLKAGDDLYAAFSVFGAYPGYFDTIYISYFPSEYWINDCEAVIGSYNLNSYFWSGDDISGTGQFYEYGVKPGLRVTATYQNAVMGQSIGNVNIKGYYNIPDSGSTLALLGGSLVLGWTARTLNRRNKK